MQTEVAANINWWNLGIQFIGGLALFLYGMMQMTSGLKSAAGEKLTTFLGKMTSNRLTSMTAGAGITAVIQSSSITTVLMVGFVSAGLMSFSKTLGIILGANIGTTITAQIIAFKITESALILVAIGYLVSEIFKSSKIKYYGSILLGLGLVFMGMNLMSKATMPLRNYEPFIEVMKDTALPVYGLLLGAGFTALVQSSSATTGVVIVLASQKLLNIESGIAMIIGANIGTCVTALLAAIGKPRPALQVAFAHVAYKSIGALIFVFFIPYMAQLVESISANDFGRQIANAHTIFNVGTAILFIGFTKPTARLIKWLLPDREKYDRSVPLLDEYYLKHTGLALDMVSQSLHKMGKDLMVMARKSIIVANRGDYQSLEALRMQDQILDAWQERILSYISQIQQLELSDKQMKRVNRLTYVANIIENAGDLYTTNIVEAAEHRINLGFSVSNTTHEKLSKLFDSANHFLELGLDSFQEKNKQKAQEVIAGKEAFAARHAEVHKHVYARLSQNEQHRIEIIRYEIELLEVARRLHSLARRIARRTIDAVEQKKTNSKTA